MKNNKLRIACRNSPLSHIQVKEVLALLPAVEYELLPMESYGDKNKHISLIDQVIDGDFFTRELDQALLHNEADIAIHSAKDLPYPLPAGIELFALTEGAEKSDSLVSKNKQTLERLPIGAKIGTSSAVRKAALLAWRSDLDIVPIRGTIEERIAQVDNGTIDALIVATCALQRLGLADRIAEILPFKTHPLQGNLAVTGRENSPLKSIFSAIDVRKNYGEVTLVGFGPGNPDLLTLGGDKALANADVIFNDDLIDADFLKKYNGDKIYVGKRKGKHAFRQEEINELVYQAAVQGKKVVRLKGGDPMIFAHGREELDFLKARFVDVRVIPGVSSGIALSAYTGIPLTHRGIASSVAFVTGHSAKEAQTPNADTLVYYMAGATIAEVAKKLIATGRNTETPAALVHNVSLVTQQTFFSTLGELRFSFLKNTTPVLLVVGDVVNFENNKQQRILLTGTNRETHPDLTNSTHTPLIKIKKIPGNTLLNLLQKEIARFDRIIFTSRHGVKFFFEEVAKTGMNPCLIRMKKIVSVGETTSAELHKHGIYQLMQSPTESAIGIVDYFKQQQITGENILLPRSDKGLKYLSEALTLLGNIVTDLPVYTNEINSAAQKVELSEFQKIIFSSPSGVEAFKKLYGEFPSKVLLVAKGETTKEKLKTILHETI
jgi:uroporphyrinogen III methyltransferase/synthase